MVFINNIECLFCIIVLMYSYLSKLLNKIGLNRCLISILEAFSHCILGNLYTHMRRHTGQFYQCRHCSFKAVNKSHVLEHEATHSTERLICKLCKHDYSTVKSLINHIRKYHHDKKGEEYLLQYMPNMKRRNVTVIHQCHVCNRKFKKKVDRDRHLFTHDIKDISVVQHCDLCDYTASRRTYLETHFQKHRIIYRCSMCSEVYISTIRLIDHVTSVHVTDADSTQWEELFEQCINSSVYLPEPERGLVNLNRDTVNIPPELMESGTSRVPGANTESARPSAETCEEQGADTKSENPPEINGMIL